MGYRVVVADDNEDLRADIAGMLARAGHFVVEASDGQKALDAMREETPDIVLLDLVMPGVDGWEVLEAMSKDRRLAAVPVVVLTGNEDVRSLPSGRAVLHKPVEFALLLDLVTTVVEQDRAASVALAGPPADLLPKTPR
jgi:adenylate cyclase